MFSLIFPHILDFCLPKQVFSSFESVIMFSVSCIDYNCSGNSNWVLEIGPRTVSKESGFLNITRKSLQPGRTPAPPSFPAVQPGEIRKQLGPVFSSKAALSACANRACSHSSSGNLTLSAPLPWCRVDRTVSLTCSRTPEETSLHQSVRDHPDWLTGLEDGPHSA